MTRTKVLLIGEGATLAHVARPAVLAGFLNADEFEATLAFDARYSPLFGELPWPVRPIRSQPSEQLLDNARSGRPLFDLATLIEYVREDLALFDEFAPDIVVGDMRISLAASTRLRRIPYVNVVSAQWNPKSTLPFEMPDDPMRQMLPIRPLADLLACVGMPLAMAWSALPVNVLRVYYGLPPISHDLKEILSYGDYAVYPDAAELSPSSALLPGHRYLGPLLWSSETALPEWWDCIPDDKPVVYVNLGSSGAAEHLDLVLRALGRLPVAVMAATGRSYHGTPAANVFCAEYLPAASCLLRAALLINNGGSMSTQQSLHAGVPVLGLVTHVDQFVFSKAVRNKGAGEFLTKAQVSEGALAPLVTQMLHMPTYRERACELRKKLTGYNPQAEFVGLLREIAKNPKLQRT